MKKLLIHLVKYINHFTNTTVTAEQEAEQIYNYMIYKGNPLRTIEIFEALESRVEHEMRIKEKEYAKVCKAVNTKWQKSPVMLTVNDPVFEQPYKKAN